MKYGPTAEGPRIIGLDRGRTACVGRSTFDLRRVATRLLLRCNQDLTMKTMLGVESSNSKIRFACLVE